MDQAIEARPFNAATRGATKIVVNHVDVGEPRRRATSTNSYCRLWLSRFD